MEAPTTVIIGGQDGAAELFIILGYILTKKGCEWYNDYEKGITKPPIRVSDLEVVELNFRGKFYFNMFTINILHA